jgi:hypothetical protein
LEKAMEPSPVPFAEKAETEVPFWQILRAAWGCFRNMWGQALVLGVWLSFGTCGAAAAMLVIIGAAMLVLKYMLHYNIDVAFGSVVSLASPFLLVATCLYWNSYLWAAISSYSRHRMDWADGKKAFRSPFFGALVRLGFIPAIFSFIFVIPALTAQLGGNVAGTGTDWTDTIKGQLVVALTQAFVTVLTLLAGPLLISSHRPRVLEALAENLRILRRRPVLFLVLALAPAAQYMLLTVLERETKDDTLRLSLVLILVTYAGCLFAKGLFYVGYVFVVAAFFRTVRGMPIEPPLTIEPAVVASPADPQL